MRAMATLREHWIYLQVFVYLQALDFLTTLVGLRLGAAEASPFVRWLMPWGATGAVGMSKLLALGLAALCVGLDRHHLIRWINYWYAILIIWNLAVRGKGEFF